MKYHAPTWGGLVALVRRRPVLATAISGVVSGGIGDTAAQLYDAGNHAGEQFSYRRLAGVMAFQGTLGPALYLPLYRWLDRRFGETATVKSVFSKVVVDDLVFSPLVEIPSFIALTSAVEGDAVAPRLKREYADCVMACWCFNIPVTIINFTVVPPPFRVIVLDAAECVMTCVLSFVSHRHTADHTDSDCDK